MEQAMAIQAQARYVAPPMSQYDALFTKLSHQAFRRVLACGAPFEIEDLKQELAICYLRCVEAYDPNGGANFMTFLIAAWWFNFTRLLTPYERVHKAAPVVSGDTPRSNDGERFTLWDYLPGDCATPDQYLEGQDLFDAIMQHGGDTARMLVAALVAQPDLIFDQLEALQEGAARARSAGADEPGVPQRGYEQVNFSYLGRLFKLSRSKVLRARHEVERAVQLYYRAEE